jgi:RimJ/RimL family protein N-acetyltransferase
MSLDHVDGLLAAAGSDRTSFGFTPVPWDRASMTVYVERALAKRDDGEQYPFVTWSVAAGRLVGATRFYDIERWDWAALPPGSDVAPHSGAVDGVGIGYTWLDPAAQRSPVNTEAKRLMLDHAFGTWGVPRVRIKTDARNERSRSAIARIGFTLDGILRADMPGADGTIRDSAVFSMLAAEWPAHRERLTARLEQ